VLQHPLQLGVGEAGEGGRIARQMSSSELGVEDHRPTFKKASPNHPE
jgi:hypothetical protein